MKYFTFLVVVLCIVGCQQKTDLEIFQDVCEDIQNIEQIQYNFTFEQKGFESSDSNYSYSGIQALDFTKRNALGADVYSKRFPRPNKTGFERLAIADTLIRKKVETKTIIKDPNAGYNFIAGNVVLYFNIYDLRKSLPLVLKDSTMNSLRIVDTLINDTRSSSIIFKIRKHIVGGQLYDTQGKSKTYHLIVKKKDHTPLYWGFDSEEGIMGFTYKNIKSTIDPGLWEYNSKEEYTVISGKEYRLRQKNELNKQLGRDFPTWKLSTIRGQELSNLNFKNKLTLYEFFFVGCKGAITSKPFIKGLKDRYGQNLNFVNIEVQGFQRKDVLNFVERHNLKEPVVYGGKDLANQLGVLGCPTYVLVDKSGKIIHSSFSDKTGLKELIDKEI